MKTVYLFRNFMDNHGTQGILVTDNFSCKTLELPWIQNKRTVSCIPTGEYIVKIRRSPKYGIVYHVKNVKKRSYILIHSGNYAGNRSKGYRSHVAGCILLGSKHGWLGRQKAILNSRITVRRFMRFMENKPFKLNIINGIPKFK